MSTPAGVAIAPLDCILAFDGNNRLAVRRSGGQAGLPFTGPDLGTARERLAAAFPAHSEPAERFGAEAAGRSYRVHLALVEGAPASSSRSSSWRPGPRGSPRRSAPSSPPSGRT